MYEKFFQFKEAPFNLTPDPRYYFPTPHHRKALAQILPLIEEGKGLILITGDVGSGKTLIRQKILNKLGKRLKAAVVFNPVAAAVDFLQVINRGFGIDSPDRSRAGLTSSMESYLRNRSAQGAASLLVVDEAQNLSAECLDVIRELSGFRSGEKSTLNILLLGQTKLLERLETENLSWLRSGLTFRYEIQPLRPDEVRDYIQARIKTAGRKNQSVFKPEAVDRITGFSRGVPGLINAVCDRSLLMAFENQSAEVDGDHVVRAIADLEGRDTRTVGQPSPVSSLFQTGSGIIVSGLIVLTVGFGIWFAVHSTGSEIRASATGPSDRSADISGKGPVPPQANPVDHPSSEITAEQPPFKSAPAPPAGGATGDSGAHRLESSVLQVENGGASVPESPEAGFDDDGIFRADRSDQTRKASFLTLLHAWGISGISPSQDLRKGLRENGLAPYESRFDLSLVRLLNYPVIVEGTWEKKGKSGYAVLKNLSDEKALLLDPLSGRRVISVEELESGWSGRGTILFRTLPGITAASRIRYDTHSIKAIQQFLKQYGLYPGEVDGFYGPITKMAVRFFQQKYGLKESGRFEPETYLVFSREFGKPAPSLMAPALN